MKKMPVKLKKLQWIVLALVTLVLLYSGFNLLKDKIATNSFFQRFNVLTVTGSDMFAYDAIALNGKIIEKSKDGWTNVLAIPNSLKYITTTSSYSQGHNIQCGDTNIPKRVEVMNMGENEWCINHNGKNIAAISSPRYYYYSDNEIVYEKCLKGGYYEGINEGRGFNGCAENGLFLNDKQIATTKEHMAINLTSRKNRLEGASSFNYHPSKKIGNSIVYSTEGGTYTYGIDSGETKQLTNNSEIKLEDIFLTDEGKTIFVQSAGSMTKELSTFLGKVVDGAQTYTNVYSAEYADGHFYMLRFADVREGTKGSSMSKVFTYELLRDGQKIENIEIDSIPPYGYSTDAIQQFPLCDTDTLVCIYENGHYAYKNRAMIPEVFGYDYYVDTMVIDGEWRGEYIPNFIGRSKPIFVNDKLKYIVFADTTGKGLYLIDLDKKWDYKDLFYKRGASVTKLLGGYQNDLLNVMSR